MSNPYRLTPSHRPVAPRPTPTSVSGYTLSNSKSRRAPIANPYDKFTQPEFDAWIGGITTSLKRALGHDEEPPPSTIQERLSVSDSERGDVQPFRPIDLPEDSDSERVDDSFAEFKARRAVGKGKARDPREGPGLGKTSVAQPIEIPSSDEEEEDEVEYSVLYPADSDVEEEEDEAEDGEGEDEADYPWLAAAEKVHNGGSSPLREDVDEGEHGDYDEEEEDEGGRQYGPYDEYDDYDEEEESEEEEEPQGPGRSEAEPIEVLSDDDEPVVPARRPQHAPIEEDQYDEEEYDEEDEEEYDGEHGEGVEYDEDEQDEDEEEFDDEHTQPRQRVEYVVDDEEDEIEEVPPFATPSEAVEYTAATSSRRATSTEVPIPALPSGVQAKTAHSVAEPQDASYLRTDSGPEGEASSPLREDFGQEVQELQYPDTSAEPTPAMRHMRPQFVNQVEFDAHLDPASAFLHHMRVGIPPTGELSFDRELVQNAEEEYIQPLDEDTSFPEQHEENNASIVEVRDPWDGPREYAQDFYSGGDIRSAPWAPINANHLTPRDDDPVGESEARMEQEAEDNEIQPLDRDTAFLHDSVGTGAVEIPDPWEGVQTYAQDYYAGGVGGAVPNDRIDPALLAVSGELDDGYSSFLTPFTGTPTAPLDTQDEVTPELEPEADFNDKFALPPAPAGVYIPPTFRARDAPIPADAEIFNVDDSDEEEEAGGDVPISEFVQGEVSTTKDRDAPVDSYDDELEYVDEVAEGINTAEAGAPAADVASHETLEEPAPAAVPVLDAKGGPGELDTPEESKEVFSSLVDWNNPPAFANGLPASASGHLATPSSEGDDSMAAEPAAVADEQTVDVAEIVQDGPILMKEQSPPPPEHTETLPEHVAPEHDAHVDIEAAESTALEDVPAPPVELRETPAEEASAQEPDQTVPQSDAPAVPDVLTILEDVVDSIMEGVTEDVVEIDQPMNTAADVDEPLTHTGARDIDSTVAELQHIVEEVISEAGSRATTFPPADLLLQELDYQGLLDQPADMVPLIGIVENREATSSPRQTPEVEALTMEVIEATESVVTSQFGSPPPISILHDATREDDLSYEDYSSSVEVDELDQDEPDRTHEHTPITDEVPVKQVEIDSGHAAQWSSSPIPDTMVSATHVETVTDPPADRTTVEEVSEGLSPIMEDTPVLQDFAPPVLEVSERLETVDASGVLAESEPADGKPLQADSLINDGLEDTVVVIPEAPQVVEKPAVSPSRQVTPEIQTTLNNPVPEVMAEVNGGEGLDEPSDALTRSKTPIQEEYRPPIRTPENAATSRIPAAVFLNTDRYTPSPPKDVPSEIPEATSPIVRTPSSPDDSIINAGNVPRTQPGPNPIAQPTSGAGPLQISETVPMHLPASSASLPPPPPFMSWPPPALPTSSNHVGQLPTQGQFSINQGPLMWQTPILQVPNPSELQYPSVFTNWPYDQSRPGLQPITSFADESAQHKAPRKPRGSAAASKSPKKGKKKEQDNLLFRPVNFDLQSPPGPSQVPATTVTESKAPLPPTLAANILDGAHPAGAEPPSAPPETISKDLQTHQRGPTEGTALQEIGPAGPSSAVPSVDSNSKDAAKQEPPTQKPKRTYKRKRDTSPGAGDSQMGKTDEKKKKRPSKRKSKLLELEGQIIGPSNGETIDVKALPKATSPVDVAPIGVATASKEIHPKPKKTALSSQSASLPAPNASHTIRPEIHLIARAGPPGISHPHGRHGVEPSRPKPPPVVPSFKSLPLKASSPKKPSLPQILEALTGVPAPVSSMPETTQPAQTAVAPEVVNSAPEAANAEHLAAEPAPLTILPSDPNLPDSKIVDTPTTDAQTVTQIRAQPPEANIADSAPQAPLKAEPVPSEVVAPVDSSTVTPDTTAPHDTPSAPVGTSTTASVGRTPASQAGTPATSTRETRSSCRYHRISLPKEEGGPRVRFLVPGCAMTNHLLMKEQEIVDHGLAPVEDAYVMIKDIERLDLGAELIKVLRVLVGHDIFREQEVYYLPSPGEQLPVKPAFRRPSTSDQPDASRHTTSPSYNSLAGSPALNKSAASVSGSTSSLSALRKAQVSERSSNVSPTDSEPDSDYEDTQSLASHPGSDRKGKGRPRVKGKRGRPRKSDVAPLNEDQVSDAQGPEGSKSTRRRGGGPKRGVKRTRTDAQAVGDDPSRQNKKLKAHPTAPSSLASPEKPAPSEVPSNPPNPSNDS